MPSRQTRRSSGVEPRFLQGTFEKIHLQRLLPPKGASTDGLACERPTHESSAEALFPLPPGNRVSSATCRDSAVLPPVPSPIPQCCRRSSCAPQPSAETSVSIASVSLCSPSPAKCAHPNCLISRVQSIREVTPYTCHKELGEVVCIASELPTLGGRPQARLY